MCLLDDAISTFDANDPAPLDTRLVLNPHSLCKLPSWIVATIEESARRFAAAMWQGGSESG